MPNTTDDSGQAHTQFSVKDKDAFKRVITVCGCVIEAFETNAEVCEATTDPTPEEIREAVLVLRRTMFYHHPVVDTKRSKSDAAGKEETDVDD